MLDCPSVCSALTQTVISALTSTSTNNDPSSILQYPTVLIARIFGVRFWTGTILVFWGATTFGIGFVTNGTQLIIGRLLLGLTESGVAVLAYMYLDRFLLPNDLTRLWGTFILVSIQLSSIISGPLASLIIIYLDGALSLAGYQWVYLITGGVAAALGLLTYILLISPPEQTSIFTEDERAALLLIKSQQRAMAKRNQPSTLTALRSWKPWYIGVMGLLFSAPNSMFQLYLPLLIEGLLLTEPGISPSEAFVYSVTLSSLPYIVGGVALLVTNEMLQIVKKSPRLFVGMAILLISELLFASFFVSYGVGVVWGFIHISLSAGIFNSFLFPLDSFPAVYCQHEGPAASFAIFNALKFTGAGLGPVVMSGFLLIIPPEVAVTLLGVVFVTPLFVLYLAFGVSQGEQLAFVTPSGNDQTSKEDEGLVMPTKQSVTKVTDEGAQP